MRRTLEAEEAVVQTSRLIKGYKEGDSARWRLRIWKYKEGTGNWNWNVKLLIASSSARIVSVSKPAA